jgi:hypothetical protein
LHQTIREDAAVKKLALSAIIGAVWAISSAASAHHSFAMFDTTKKVDVKGTVKELQWTNPHVWLQMVVSENGQQKTYDFEGGAVAVLKRSGWTKDMVKPGDAITLTAHPFKDGRPGGSIDFVTLADGRKVGGGDGIPGAVVVGGK